MNDRRPPTLTFFKGEDGDTYFKIRAGGNRAELVRSTEGYEDPADARHAADLLALALGDGELEIVDETASSK